MFSCGMVLRKDLEDEANRISNNSKLVDVKVKKYKNKLAIVVINNVKNSMYEFTGCTNECMIFLRGLKSAC